MYEGTPSVYLTPIAQVIREKLAAHWRCVYLNSAEMAAGMRACLAVNGVDVERETKQGSLVISSEREYLVDGRFDVEKTIKSFKDAHDQALRDGFQGLFGTGDMTWEFGPAGDFSKLVEYEMALEEMLRAHPNFSVICQYHASTLPAEVLQRGLAIHPGMFINETLSVINPRFVHRRTANGASQVPGAGPIA